MVLFLAALFRGCDVMAGASSGGAIIAAAV